MEATRADAAEDLCQQNLSVAQAALSAAQAVTAIDAALNSLGLFRPTLPEVPEPAGVQSR